MRDDKPEYPDPKEEDIYAGDRRISRPDASLPDWEVPDSAYRPIPIVWFTGAFFAHLILGSAIVFVTPAGWPALAFGLCAVAAGAVGKWTWDRGMGTAGTGWKVATVAMLAFNLLFFAAVAYSP